MPRHLIRQRLAAKWMTSSSQPQSAENPRGHQFARDALPCHRQKRYQQTNIEESIYLKQQISNVLAWIGFIALIVWLLSLAIGFTRFWEFAAQINTFIAMIRECESDSCSVQMSVEDSGDPIVFGINLAFMLNLRMPAFLIWFVIVMFQSFYVRKFRFWPWQPIESNPATNLEDRR